MPKALNKTAINIIGSKIKSLKIHDPELFSLITAEKKRQIENIELIASENFTSKPVLECLGSELTNKYSEGRPGSDIMEEMNI